MGAVINGIQQIGIGVTNAKEVFNWYRRVLAFDILLFEDTSTANLMTQYTENEQVDRYAILALNMRGGGGLEIWQPTSRTAAASIHELLLGDPGINAMKIRTSDIIKTHQTLANEKGLKLGQVYTDEKEIRSFFFKDPWNNMVQLVEEHYHFTKTPSKNGGVLGAIIGVNSLETSVNFYKGVLGYEIAEPETTGLNIHLADLPGGNRKLRRIVLKSGVSKKGGFSQLFGPSQIELIQTIDHQREHIFKNRQWGDLGFIHLCFDIHGMDALQTKCVSLNHPFTVDSKDSFDMGEAAGRFGYVEDPDGTLIEFVETHRVPIAKRFGWYLDLKKRNPLKPLPSWIVRCLKIHKRTKDLI
jgi:catechol 2,3-dioxygenase-like lactoylglutathione lyase family enzyme